MIQELNLQALTLLNLRNILKNSFEAYRNSIVSLHNHVGELKQIKLYKVQMT